MGSPSPDDGQIGNIAPWRPGIEQAGAFLGSHDHGQLVIRGAQGQVGAQIAVGDINMYAVVYRMRLCMRRSIYQRL